MTIIRGHFKNSSLILVLICIISFLIRLSFFIALEPWNEEVVRNKIVIGDSARYTTYALGVLTSHSFSNFDAFAVPGYPLFLAFIYFLFGTKPWIVLLLQVFLDTCIVIIVYFMAKEIFQSDAIALIAAFLYSINFLSAYYSIRLLTEIPFTLLFALSVLFFIKGLKKNKPSGFLLAGLFVGLATLVRPITQYFPAVFIIILIFSGSKIAQKLRNILILLIVFCAVISPWQIHNLRTYGYYALSTTSGKFFGRTGTVLAKVNAEKISRDEALEELVGNSLEGVTNPFEESKIYKKIAVEYIFKNPLQYAKYFLKRIVIMFLGTGRSGISDLFGIKTKPFAITEGVALTAHKMIADFYNELPFLILVIKQLLEYVFLIIGLVIMWAKDKDKKIFALFIIMIICYFTVLSGVLAYSRLRVPITPFYLAISAKGVFETFCLIFEKTSPSRL